MKKNGKGSLHSVDIADNVGQLLTDEERASWTLHVLGSSQRGTNHHNLMPQTLDLLDSLPGDFSITAVVGPYFDNTRAIGSAAEKAKALRKLVYGRFSLCNLMLPADVAMSAARQALYELGRVGCSTVAFQTAPDQQGQLTALAEAGCLLAVGDAQKSNVSAGLRDAISYLLHDIKPRLVMAAESQRLVDGTGAQRVATAVVDVMHGPTDVQSQNSLNKSS